MGLFCITHSTHNSSGHVALFGNGFRYMYDFDCKSYRPVREKNNISLIEKAILKRASKGLTTEQIADELSLSVNTIKTHKTRLFRKLHVHSMNEAIVFVSNYDL